MRLIYGGKDGSEVIVGGIVFRAGRVSSDIRDAKAKVLVAQPHLDIREASAEEIAAADGAALAKAAIKAIEDFSDEVAKLPKKKKSSPAAPEPAEEN